MIVYEIDYNRDPKWEEEKRTSECAIMLRRVISVGFS